MVRTSGAGDLHLPKGPGDLHLPMGMGDLHLMLRLGAGDLLLSRACMSCRAGWKSGDSREGVGEVGDSSELEDSIDGWNECRRRIILTVWLCCS